MKSQLTPPLPSAGEPTRAQVAAIWQVLAGVMAWAPEGHGSFPENRDAWRRQRALTDLLGAPPDGPLPGTAEDLARALESLRTGPPTVRRLTLHVALEAALLPGTLALTQNLVLRTVCEGLGLGVPALVTLFRDRTGAQLPSLWDPSRPQAWAGRERGGPGPRGVWDDAQPQVQPPTPRAEGDERIARIKALALLGLDEGASREDIRKAFHRISKVHHPDHYLAQGAEAGREATEIFRRIKAAHDFLLGSVP